MGPPVISLSRHRKMCGTPPPRVTSAHAHEGIKSETVSERSSTAQEILYANMSHDLAPTASVSGVFTKVKT